MLLKIANKDDLLTVAAILVKNGYTVSMTKIRSDAGKVVSCVKIVEEQA